MWKIEKFGKNLTNWKFGISLKNFFYRGKMKSGKILKNMLEFGESGKICKNLVKSVKNRKIFSKFEKLKIWNYCEKYFLPQKNEKWKILEKYARIWGKWKNLVKSVKIVKFGKSLKSFENLELFWKIFFTAEKGKVENSWKMC